MLKVLGSRARGRGMGMGMGSEGRRRVPMRRMAKEVAPPRAASARHICSPASFAAAWSGMGWRVGLRNGVEGLGEDWGEGWGEGGAEVDGEGGGGRGGRT